jgi:predicted membrane protein
MKTLRLLFGLSVLVSAVYVGWKVLPIYINNYQFEEAIDDSARAGAMSSQKTEDDIRQLLFREAQDLRIPIRPEDIQVQRESGEMKIWVDYTVHVELPVYPLDLNFHPASNRKALTFR